MNIGSLQPLNERKYLYIVSATILAAILVVASIGSLFLAAASDDDSGEGSTTTFIAIINGGQENPPTPSKAFGVAHMTFNDGTRMLCYSISYTGPSSFAGVETSAHFHGPAEAGVNAGIQFSISPAPSALGSPKNDCVGPLSDDQEDDLKDGLFYINIHTSKIVDLIQVGFPGGEIRGQVLPIGDDDSD